MKIEDLFLTIDQAKHLQELGLDMSDSVFVICIYKIDDRKYDITKRNSLAHKTFSRDKEHYEFVPTYTLQEILDKLPKIIDGNYVLDGRIDDCVMYYVNSRNLFRELGLSHSKNLLETAYDLLCWLIGNGYLKS